DHPLGQPELLRRPPERRRADLRVPAYHDPPEVAGRRRYLVPRRVGQHGRTLQGAEPGERPRHAGSWIRRAARGDLLRRPEPCPGGLPGRLAPATRLEEGGGALLQVVRGAVLTATSSYDVRRQFR